LLTCSGLGACRRATAPVTIVYIFWFRNLQEGHRYSFRIAAANKIGQSEPREYRGTDILTKDPWGTYHHPYGPPTHFLIIFQFGLKFVQIFKY
jgi:hypothetical protein